MTTVIQICQGSLPGRWLVIISTPSIERPPAVGSRGTEAATTLSGAHRRMWLSLTCSDGGKMVVMARMDVSGPGCLREIEMERS